MIAGFPFVGMLFTGLMITPKGPRVLEYNVRFGDPECETLLPLLAPETDLAEIMVACTDGWLDAVTIKVQPTFSTCVIAVAPGYPGKYPKGDEISFAAAPEDTTIFHAGTTRSDGVVRTNGGRVLAVTATGPDLQTARDRAYQGIASVSFRGKHYRTDIGHRALRAPPNPHSTSKSTHAPADASEPLTYAAAGVSIDAGNALIPRLAPLAASTARPGADASLGGFGGLFDLAAAFPASRASAAATTTTAAAVSATSASASAAPLGLPRLVAGIDGVGTKLALAHAAGTPTAHACVGADCVAMNVNDLVVQGAEPLLFLDCFTCAALDVDVAEAFVSGVAGACREAGCALVGGETAEMPGLLREVEGVKKGGVYDAVGAAVGAVWPGERVLPAKDAMRAGDVLVGVASRGCHANGFSLVRTILARAGLGLQDPAPWDDAGRTVGASLLTPTRVYARPLLRAARAGLVKGMAHVTGGGLPDNVPRMLPAHLAAELYAVAWELPRVMRWLGRAGNVAPREMARTWNCGLGMVLVVALEQTGAVQALLHEAGDWAGVVGRVKAREEGAEGCTILDTEGWGA